ncbi:copper amine oxidase N-terminal domain-containing protein [Paenibacillus sp. MDMC362]|uniref:copper amine oxidase N-terminal domain-containing protein n=1 Tax=Paenibacillus sp. MDMC362 TaxID=2977365 RepID=UPI000DC50A48|nr:copper amine oxidase N-terminal domain-containing protein [Paenibacillus sp. MDMC362]RAR42864.1 copper amine oxidase N-terminal domain-containing protein [Paenibacillus sp. MDMC362]
MNKQWKKQAATLMVAAIAVSGGAAAYAAPQAGDSQEQKPVVISAVMDYGVLVNGKQVAGVGYMNADAKQVMIPLRSVSEALGFELGWNQEARSAELTKPGSPIWTLVKTGKDQYAVNKMYKSLGAAPANVNGTLYVPANFFSEVLHANVSTDGTKVSISSEEEVKKETVTGKITEIINNEDRQAVHINGTGTEGILLNVDQNTVIRDEEGKGIKFKDLAKGMEIEAVHSLAMTMSLPPQTYAYEISVKSDKEETEQLATAGAITDINADGGNLRVTIKGKGLTKPSPNEVVLNLTAETVVVNKDGKTLIASDLTADAEIIGYYSPVLTKSLPPIGHAIKIVLQ